MDVVELGQRLGWRSVTSACGGCQALVRGTEIHVVFTRKGVILRRKTQEFLEPLLNELGFLTTRVPLGDGLSQRFVQKLGFRPTWNDDKFAYFMLSELPFKKD